MCKVGSHNLGKVRVSWKASDKGLIKQLLCTKVHWNTFCCSPRVVDVETLLHKILNIFAACAQIGSERSEDLVASRDNITSFQSATGLGTRPDNHLISIKEGANLRAKVTAHFRNLAH